MGRSSVQQASQNRARIVEAASRLFRERGVDAVSVSEVMGAAGMTVGGFYKHFASKEALVREACTLSFDQAARVWKKLIGRDGNIEGAAVIVDHYFRARPAYQTCPMLAYAPHVSDADSTPAREVYSNGAGALLSDFLACAVERDDPETRQEAQIMFAAMIGAQFLARASAHAEWATALQQAVTRRAATPPHADQKKSE